MAKNWTITEAYRVLKAGTNQESMTDICRRFPNMVACVIKMSTGDITSIDKFFDILPEYLTAGKVNKAFKESANDASDVEEDLVEETEEDVSEEEETKEKPKRNKKSKKVEVEEESDDISEDNKENAIDEGQINIASADSSQDSTNIEDEKAPAAGLTENNSLGYIIIVVSSAVILIALGILFARRMRKN